MARSALDEMTESGAFNRTPSTFRNFISKDKTSQFPAESGRYHLYISYACPWASRCLSFVRLKGLDKAISYTVTLYILGMFILGKYIITFEQLHLIGCQTNMGKDKGER